MSFLLIQNKRGFSILGRYSRKLEANFRFTDDFEASSLGQSSTRLGRHLSYEFNVHIIYDGTKTSERGGIPQNKSRAIWSSVSNVSRNESINETFNPSSLSLDHRKE